ncbi:MAG: winged helix-turn-helix transcriptional regulator [Candidatus Aenigmarchaeota archaeon]|nr:winged helix-turn-helix transcriptional regulator [Candidatus Aenigmarchaeota archaeon]
MDPSFLEEIILNILRQSDTSLTILEIAEKARIHRVTASKYLAVLEARGHVKRRDVGKAKLYSPAGGSPMDNTKFPELPVFNGNYGGDNE